VKLKFSAVWSLYRAGW